ncbi:MULTISPECIES: ATP-binding cassette domain-containing protein [Anaerococcus]|jgi:ABC superfamily ATP binding cassette transporter, ATP binding protein|uniref:ATP-binding cassette domain-containing protein n=1 Tax=Anaerococcus nagyae TaxID=1755241 RepID=A0A3E2TFY1_9FIRM|nr:MULTISPECIES: ATP-binding cassette domain-containing protein [Anaerococcus]MBP2070092.1 ABC-2 type transport system ATP-binding protein [Anaerococcus nagyae]MDU1829157.1 ATP-binding cassette domain-containing protein [Anaerococcus sp.]MDU1865014.1 ATP-binding cassette domain-containing protein [Anaerococcus sp.]MDU2353710.1 ATP-binding cassette domain-containing protein [Anaerococcus sp.]MDU2566365.1 ATP-binding cassette domain-containing protein [Anaerococcus sp.]
MRLVIENLSKKFEEKSVLMDLSAKFDQGIIYALLGRNGAGKTTLFSLISKELKKDSGEIYLLEDDEKIDINLKDVFFMLAEPELPRFLTAREFINFFIDVNKERINDNLDPNYYFDLVRFDEEDKDRLIQGYSTGMRNKLQMMMFLILKPKVILMDEPLNSLDVVVQKEMKNLIKYIKNDHIIIFSTHILDLAKDISDEIVLLHKGQIEEVDREIKNNPDFEEKIIDLLQKED